MTTENDEGTEDIPSETERASAPKVSIRVKAGHTEDRIIELEVGSRVTAILDIIAAERGCRAEELILIRDGEDEPLTAVVLIDADYPQKLRHHVHHAGEVAVTVYYQAQQDMRRFQRSAIVDDVLAWAIAAFNVDPNMASEFELTHHGQKEELPGSEHIGHLAAGRHEVALDLVRGDIANGSCT